MQLLKLKIRHPASFLNTEERSFKSDLYVIPKAKGLGIIGLAELIISISTDRLKNEENIGT